MSKGYFPGWGLSDDTVERLGYKVRGKHNGIVSPSSIDISNKKGPATKEEPGFTWAVPEDRAEKLTLSFAPISKETEELKKDLEKLKEENKYFSFYDENNRRYINSINSYTSSYNGYFHFYLSKVHKYYRSDINKYNGRIRFEKDFCFPIETHDFCTIEKIMTCRNSRIVLKHNKYNFFKESREYRNNDEEEYCKIVTEVLTEIMIKYYNYLKYGVDPNDKEKSEMLLNAIETNYQSHVEEANKQNNILKKMLRM